MLLNALHGVVIRHIILDKVDASANKYFLKGFVAYCSMETMVFFIVLRKILKIDF